MAVVRYRTKLHLPRLGVCSNWLANINLEDEDTESNAGGEKVTTVPIWVKRGTIRFPSDPNVPLIMVGPGTDNVSVTLIFTIMRIIVRHISLEKFSVL